MYIDFIVITYIYGEDRRTRLRHIPHGFVGELTGYRKQYHMMRGSCAGAKTLFAPGTFVIFITAAESYFFFLATSNGIVALNIPYGVQMKKKPAGNWRCQLSAADNESTTFRTNERQSMPQVLS